MAKWGCLIVIGLVLAFVLAAALGAPFAWEALFGIAYCLDGYGGCPWQ